jgi:hypothetical protein
MFKSKKQLLAIVAIAYFEALLFTAAGGVFLYICAITKNRDIFFSGVLTMLFGIFLVLTVTMIFRGKASKF